MERELSEWLGAMVVPEDGKHVLAGSGYDWSQHEENEVHGVTLNSNSQADIEKAFRVLKPGGHLFLVAPEEEPTGHTGACIAEDLGFEIRDSILVLSQPKGFVYSGKTTSKEREEGCYLVEEKSFGMSGGANQSIDKGEDQYGSAQSIGLNRVTKRRNSHPTVKPRAVMQHFLSDLETDKGAVVDPFMGSGTTGMACLRTGHDFIGIEREEEYAKIADSRIRHWAFAEESWVATRIDSDVAPEVEYKTEEVSFTDLFGI